MDARAHRPAPPANAIDPVSAQVTSGAPAGPPVGHVTAEMIAERLAARTGRGPVLPSTIRSMSSRGRLPAPAELRWGRRTLWREADIERWLAEHEATRPSREIVRRQQRRLAALDAQAQTSGNDARLKEAVRSAHRRGLSFQQIADAITVKGSDRHPTREAVRHRFADYL